MISFTVFVQLHSLLLLPVGPRLSQGLSPQWVLKGIHPWGHRRRSLPGKSRRRDSDG